MQQNDEIKIDSIKMVVENQAAPEVFFIIKIIIESGKNFNNKS